MPKSEIEGFILAGGASSRMGRNKATLRLGGKTLIDRAAQALSSVVAERVFAVGNFEENSTNLPVLADLTADNLQRGSLVGLHTALSHAKAHWAAILACDLPFATGALFERLFLLGKTQEFETIVPVQPDGRLQPLCALYRPTACLPHVEECLGGDDWSLQKLLSRLNARRVRFSEISDLPDSDNFFLNVNTPADFATAEAILAKR